MSLPDGPKSAGTGPVNPQRPTSQNKDISARETGTTNNQREVKTVTGQPTRGLRANTGDSRAPTTNLSERNIKVHPVRVWWNSVVTTVKGWFRQTPAERTEQSAESLFQARQKTDEPRDLSNTRITADDKTPKFSELLKHAPVINGKPSVSFVDFSNCQFDLKNLSGVHFTNCSFEKADLSDCFLENTSFSGCNFNHANLKGVQGDQVCFNHCAMKQTDLSESLLSNSHFEGNSLNKASFSKATLIAPTMTNDSSGKMKNCNFQQASIEQARAPELLNCGNSFVRATLKGMKVGYMRLNDGFSGATLINVQSDSGSVAMVSGISDLRMEDSDLRFGKVPDAPGVQCSLYNCAFNNVRVHANGNRVNMNGCEFRNTRFAGAEFTQGTWAGVTFSNSCNMQGMKTRSMEIKDSSFRNCDMRNSRHQGNGIYRCTFFSSDMEGCSFRYLPNSAQGTVANTRFHSVVGLPDAWVNGQPTGISVSGVTISNCTAAGTPTTLVTLNRPVYN